MSGVGTKAVGVGGDDDDRHITNAAAAAIRLSPQDLTELDLAFPPPVTARPLETL